MVATIPTAVVVVVGLLPPFFSVGRVTKKEVAVAFEEFSAVAVAVDVAVAADDIVVIPFFLSTEGRW